MRAVTVSSVLQSGQMCDNSSEIPVDRVGKAGQNCRPIRLRPLELYLVSEFLKPKDLGRLERVNKAFQIAVGNQWESLCRIQLGLPSGTDLTLILPKDLSVKKSVQLLSNNVFDERVYVHIGHVKSAPQIPKLNFLNKHNEPDPCDPTTTIGREYVLIYVPEDVIINQSGVSLSEVANPNDPQEAPRLIRMEDLSSGSQSEKTTLKVALTINNIKELFKFPEAGNPSTYFYIWDAIVKQHGNKRNKRIPSGYICMRRNVIGTGLQFAQQQALANQKGVVLSELLPRILFNCLVQARSKKVGVYPDGGDKYCARTSMLTRDSGGYNWPSGCGEGSSPDLQLDRYDSPSGLQVDHYDSFGFDYVGLAVELPEEVQKLCL